LKHASKSSSRTCPTSGAGRTAARCPAGASRADRCPALPPVGGCPGRRSVPALDDGAWRWAGGGATVDVPARFRKSKSVGAVFGLTCSRDQSGERDRPGAISRCGDAMMRTMLYEAAQSMLVHSTRWSWLKAWAMKIARRRGMKRAIVALARRLAVIMHRIWVDGTEFRWTREASAAA
jgi:hypothetical protein